jgi:hypothetical protein
MIVRTFRLALRGAFGHLWGRMGPASDTMTVPKWHKLTVLSGLYL